MTHDMRMLLGPWYFAWGSYWCWCFSVSTV